MAKARSRTSATPKKEPIIKTAPALALIYLQARVAEIEKLDPEIPNDPRFDDAERNFQADVKEIFGEDSPEDIQNWSHQIYHSNDPQYLRDHDQEEPEHPYALKRRAIARKVGIERTLVRLRSLIDRVNERVNARSARGGRDMSLLAEFAKSKIVLRKQSGSEHEAMAKFESPTKLLVPDKRFPVEVGDAILYKVPSGVLQELTVTNVHFEDGLDDDLSHYVITVANTARRAAAAAPSSVVHNYNVTGQVGAVGSNASAIGNTLVQHNTRQTWNEADLGQIADDLVALRKVLLAQAADDEDDAEAAIEVGNVAAAQKALKSGDNSGFLGAMRRLGAKAWNAAQDAGLAYVNYKLREKLGLPPPGGTAGQ